MKMHLSLRWLYVPFLAGMTICLTACLTENRADLPIMESFQMGNTSSQDVMLSFFEKGEPKTVYTEIYNQSSPVYVTQETSKREATLVRSSGSVTIPSGQTAIFYIPEYGGYETPIANSLQRCGFGSRYFSFCGTQNRFIGDSVILFISNEPATYLPIADYSQWETWYDEKNFIYYHFWRIE